jgi:hypothetical protein
MNLHYLYYKFGKIADDVGTDVFSYTIDNDTSQIEIYNANLVIWLSIFISFINMILGMLTWSEGK